MYTHTIPSCQNVHCVGSRKWSFVQGWGSGCDAAEAMQHRHLEQQSFLGGVLSLPCQSLAFVGVFWHSLPECGGMSGQSILTRHWASPRISSQVHPGSFDANMRDLVLSTPPLLNLSVCLFPRHSSRLLLSSGSASLVLQQRDDYGGQCYEPWALGQMNGESHEPLNSS